MKLDRTLAPWLTEYCFPTSLGQTLSLLKKGLDTDLRRVRIKHVPGCRKKTQAPVRVCSSSKTLQPKGTQHKIANKNHCSVSRKTTRRTELLSCHIKQGAPHFHFALSPTIMNLALVAAFNTHSALLLHLKVESCGGLQPLSCKRF